MVGTTVSHYMILELLGGGGMGVVYKAEDARLKRTVALKFLPPELTRDPDAKHRFMHEAQSASALDHPNICTIHEVDETQDGRMFIAMAFYDGETVKKLIERSPLKLDDALDIAIQVCQGLAKAHGAGMVHRDIKPANVMVTKDGVAKIVDFGLAKLAGMSRLTQAGSSVGTAGYMSPEQARGDEVDHRTDIWSLGVMLYEMITGLLPFRGDYENAVIYSIMSAQPEPLTALRTGIPLELEQIVGKALAKAPAERYQHVDELLVDLRRVRRQGEPETARHTVAVTVAPPRRRLRRRIVVATALGLGAVLAFLLLKPIFFEEVLISEPKPIAVISFANQTGDRTYDYLREAIPNLLITSLEQSRYLRVMTWERMRDLLDQMGKKDVEIIDRDLGFELCRREGIQAVVVGSFVKAGETFATDVKVLDVNTKELLKSASARGDGVQSILNSQIDELSKEIALGVGLSRRTVDAAPSQIAEMTTSSLDAYNYFLRGREDIDKMYTKQARQFLERAVALDSTFALAYLYLAKACREVLDFPAAREAIIRAKSLSVRAPEKERLFIESRYATIVERDSKKRSDLLGELTQKYPMEKEFHHELAVWYFGEDLLRESEQELNRALQLDPNYASAVNQLAYVYTDQGLYDKAIQTFRRYASLSPGDANPFDSMGELYLIMGNLDESVARYTEAVRARPDFFAAYRSLAYVHALKEEYGECLRWMDSLLAVAPSRAVRGEAIAWRSTYFRLMGRSRESQRAIEQLSDLVRTVNIKDYGPVVDWMRAWRAADGGELDGARLHMVKFLKGYAERTSNPLYSAVLSDVMLAYLDIKSGKQDSARARLERAKSQVGSATSGEILPMLIGLFEGELLLSEGLPDSAIRVVRRTPVIGPRMIVGWRMPMYNIPHERDIVPRAFQKKGELDSAIAEYGRMLTIDPATKDRRLINPVIHYRLAKLCEQTGRTEKAVSEYRRFLGLWNSADRDLPELIDARKRMSALAQRH